MTKKRISDSEIWNLFSQKEWLNIFYCNFKYPLQNPLKINRYIPHFQIIKKMKYFKNHALSKSYRKYNFLDRDEGVCRDTGCTNARKRSSVNTVNAFAEKLFCKWSKQNTTKTKASKNHVSNIPQILSSSVSGIESMVLVNVSPILSFWITETAPFIIVTS